MVDYFRPWKASRKLGQNSNYSPHARHATNLYSKSKLLYELIMLPPRHNKLTHHPDWCCAWIRKYSGGCDLPSLTVENYPICLQVTYKYDEEARCPEGPFCIETKPVNFLASIQFEETSPEGNNSQQRKIVWCNTSKLQRVSVREWLIFSGSKHLIKTRAIGSS